MLCLLRLSNGKESPGLFCFNKIWQFDLYMDKRFFNFFNLTEDQAIALLDTPQDQLSEDDSRYIAASHLINFPTERSINALMRAVQQTDHE